jgi:hypothetical protein
VQCEDRATGYSCGASLNSTLSIPTLTVTVTITVTHVKATLTLIIHNSTIPAVV